MNVSIMDLTQLMDFRSEFDPAARARCLTTIAAALRRKQVTL